MLVDKIVSCNYLQKNSIIYNISFLFLKGHVVKLTRFYT